MSCQRATYVHFGKIKLALFCIKSYFFCPRIFTNFLKANNWVRLGSFWVRFSSKLPFKAQKSTKIGFVLHKKVIIGQLVFAKNGHRVFLATESTENTENKIDIRHQTKDIK